MNGEYLNDQCYTHGDEPIPKTGYYKLCGECWHCYVTPEELLDAHNKILISINAPTISSVEEIFICPLCTHDF